MVGEGGESPRPDLLPSTPIAENLPSERPFTVFIGGNEQKAKPIAHIRDYLTDVEALQGESVYFPAPISRKPAVEGAPIRASEYHKQVATDLLDRSSGRNLRIIAQSAGGHEVIDILDHMLQQGMTDRQIELVLFTVPGLVEGGIRGELRTYPRLARILTSIATVEQHVVNPLPDKFYDHTSVDFTTDDPRFQFIKDTPEQRSKRRAHFQENVAKVISDPIQQIYLTEAVSRIDELVVGALENPALTEAEREIQLEDLLKVRAKFMKTFTSAFFKGDFVSDEMVARYAEMYGETTKDTNFGQMLFHVLPFYGKMMGNVVTGYQDRLKILVDQARSRNVSLRFAVALSEHDPLVRPDEMKKIADRFQQAGIEDLATIVAFEQFGHTSIAHDDTQLTHLATMPFPEATQKTPSH